MDNVKHWGIHLGRFDGIKWILWFGLDVRANIELEERPMKLLYLLWTL